TGAQAADFGITADNTCPTGAGSVAPGASCTISVSFTPLATGIRNATLNIVDDAAGSPHTINLTSTGIAPAVTLSANSVAFGNQRVGTTSVCQNITLTNNDAASLHVALPIFTGAQAADFAFAAGNTCPTGAGSVTPGASCTIGVSFTPAAPGARAAAVNITDDAVGSPQSVSLAGTGIAPAVTLAPTNLAFGTQRVST